MDDMTAADGPGFEEGRKGFYNYTSSAINQAVSSVRNGSGGGLIKIPLLGARAELWEPGTTDDKSFIESNKLPMSAFEAATEGARRRHEKRT